MNVAVLAPTAVALCAVAVGWFLPDRLPPRAATRALTVAVAAAAVATVAALVQLALAGASELPFVSRFLGWCDALYAGQHGAAPVVGVGAGAVLVAMGVASRRHRNRIRAESDPFRRLRGVVVIDAAGPVAFAVPPTPGRTGGAVVVGDELWGLLDDRERAVVIAHERAHLRFGHHRYVRVAETCAAALPFLAPCAARVRFATERWADEAAATEVGSRRLVARTIARVALMRPSDGASRSLAFGGSETVARVDALLGEQRRPTTTAGLFVAVVVFAVSVATAAQLHGLVAFFDHT